MNLIMFFTFIPIYLFIIWLLFRFYIYYKRNAFRKVHSNLQSGDSLVIAFFHPFCNAGGGGERVLWSALQVLHNAYPQHIYVIYSDHYEIEPSEILQKAKNTFQIDIDFNVHFVELKGCRFWSAKYYPIFTMLGQNFFSILLGLQALVKCPPDVLIDTIGANCIFPLFKLASSTKIAAYVHYPIIHVEMLQTVANNVTNYNNHKLIARNPVLTSLKLLYYRLFAKFYRFTGKCTNVIMVNSSWTKGHLEQIWNTKVYTVFPPCNTIHLKKLNLNNKNQKLIVSMAQFRPEKNHQLQIETMKLLKQTMKPDHMPTLAIIGSCRNEEDHERVEQLRKLSKKEGVDKWVQFHVNLPYKKIETMMENASIAMHTMVNEHFGISVVEFLASGLLTVAHSSGGPLMDIIKNDVTGFLAKDVEQFANQLTHILLDLSDDEAMLIRTRARNSADRFSEQAFKQAFLQQMERIL